MKDGLFTITENIPLTADVYRMRLLGDTSAIVRPGQFVNIRIDGLYLRRPLSVCDLDGDELTVIYRNVGAGTAKMSAMTAGGKLQVMTGLGNGFDISRSGNRPLLIGGGSGVPPLYLLAKRLVCEGRSVNAVLGFNSSDEVLYESEFIRLGCTITVTTADGSRGVKGLVTDVHIPGCTCVYTCGPEPMLKAVHAKYRCPGQFSFDRRMGCGFGACMGCTCRTVTGGKRICKEGPVLDREEIIWED